jgi:hypothetical protein
MKKMLLLCSMVIGNTVSAGDMLGILTQLVPFSGGTSTQNSPYICTKAMYTNGGLTFTWDTGLFPQDPYVYFGLVYQGDISTIDIYTYVSYDKSVNGITVKVYDSTNTEIASDLVEVHLFATCQDPDGLSSLVN